jgi:serine/threonine protein kinase
MVKDNAATLKESRSNDGMTRIINFFLNLYQLQLGASYSAQDPTEVIPLRSHRTSPVKAFELRVKHADTWKSRRMTIEPMDVGSGSKSTCYKVTYDEMLVVKVPPRSINDFNEYINGINFERRIVDRLSSDIECIAPSISVVLQRIPRFYDKQGLRPEELEIKYTKWLKDSPQLQKYLKIGDSFAYFMDLSKYEFFSSVLHKIHNIQKELQKEILSNYDALWDLELFEQRYGTENAAAFFSINDVNTYFEKEISPFLEQYFESMSAVPMHIRREWLLYYLAGKEIDKTGLDLPEDFYNELDTLMKKLFVEKEESIQNYTQTIRQYIREKNYDQYTSQFKGVIANIIDLLARLKDKGVAIRDLKPQNIFIATKSTKSHFFLASAGAFSLGLIDFETAVCFRTENRGEMDQPLLAGTPFYATPSHLFKNDVLGTIHADLPRVLHLQDWHAAVAMIFFAVTGQRLFDRTGKILPEITRMKQDTDMTSLSLAELYNNVNVMFWHNARQEFTDKIAANHEILKSVRTTLSRNASRLIRHEVRNHADFIKDIIRSRVAMQTIFKSKKSHRDLNNCSHKAISRCRQKWQNGVDVPKTRPKIRTIIIELLQDLEDLKLELKQINAASKVLKQKPLKISAAELLELMFKIVSQFMDQMQKMDDESDELTISDQELAEITQEETATYEATLSAGMK